MAKLGFLHTVMGMDLSLCLSGVRFPFFSNSPLKHPFRKCHPHAQALVRAGHTLWCHLLLLLEVENAPPSPPLQPHQERLRERHATKPMRYAFRNFVVMLRKSRSSQRYCWARWKGGMHKSGSSGG